MNRRKFGILLASCLALAWATQRSAHAEVTRVSRNAATSQPEANAPKVEEAKSGWQKNLSSGLTDAQRQRRLVVVKAGAVWCGWCRKLDGEMSNEGLKAELANWTCVEIDIDKAKADARKLGIGPVPAIRVLRPDGRVAASQDGYLPAADLTQWLKTERLKIDLKLDDELTRQGPPSDEALTALIKAFASQEAATREAAVRRIIPHAAAAKAVADAFISGNLATRLSALEVLSEWKAPIDELDPWKPETITTQRGEELGRWAAAFKDAPLTTTNSAQPAGLPADLDAYIQAGSDSEAAAIGERLARQRDALLPLVYARLKDAPSDQVLARLTRLRYRLAASDERALKWPTGLALLASTDATARRAAANELADSATEADVALLTELFGDSEPIVREISLKALKKVGGSAANQMLTRLLADPDANVRAAVLKELAAQPNEALVAKVIAYVGTETDADLVVHAIHVLSAAGSNETVKCLIGLISHSQWQVRAEAAEAIGHAIQKGSKVSSEVKEKATTAMVEVLGDADSFVVSRAFQALSTSGDSSVPKLTAAQIEQLIDKHPELATDAVMMVVGGKDTIESMLRFREQFGELNDDYYPNQPKIDPNAVQTLRQLAVHKLPAVRAKAVSMLAEVAPKRTSRALTAAIADEDSSVRVAAAAALLKVMQSYKPKPLEPFAGINTYERQAMPSSGGGLLGALFGTRPSRKPPPPPEQVASTQPAVAWPESFKAGRDRPKWMGELNEPLSTMLHSESAEERAVAAAPAIVLGNEEEAIAILIDTLKTDASQADIAAAALPWLTSANRSALLEAMLAHKLSPKAFNLIAARLGGIRDTDSPAALWRLLESPDVPADSAGAIYTAISSAYYGKANVVYVDSDAPDQSEKRQRIVDDATGKVASGNDVQRLVALSLLASSSPQTALPLAREMVHAEQISETLRRDAFQIMLICTDKPTALAYAVTVLDHADAGIRRLALQCVAQVGGMQSSLRGGHIYISNRINNFNEYAFMNRGGRGKAIAVEPIPDVDPAKIRPFLTDTDSEMRGYAAYILATLNDSSRIGQIAAVWREKGNHDPTWSRLLWRAISAADADGETAVLEELYTAMTKSDYRIREFYWTIHSMTGPRAKALCTRIKKEVDKYQLE